MDVSANTGVGDDAYVIEVRDVLDRVVPRDLVRRVKNR